MAMVWASVIICPPSRGGKQRIREGRVPCIMEILPLTGRRATLYSSPSSGTLGRWYGLSQGRKGDVMRAGVFVFAAVAGLAIGTMADAQVASFGSPSRRGSTVGASGNFVGSPFRLRELFP